MIRPLTFALSKLVGEALDAARQDEVRVAHEDHREALRERPPELEHGRHRGARRERLRARRVDHRAVRQRVGERHAELDEVGAAVGVGLADRPRRLEVGEAAHQVRHQRGAPVGRRERRGDALDARAHRSSAESASARSLSPRPERQIRSSSDGPARERPGDRVGGLERRDDALQPRHGLERVERLRVGDRLVGGAAGVAQVRVLRAGAGVVEAGRDRVRLEDLAVLVLHDRRVGAVQDAAAAPERERRAVAAGLDPVAGGLDADQLHLGVVDERHEDADRVGAAADARDHALGQPARLREHLRARLVADHALEVAHDRRERRRADARADDVVGVADVGDPVADRGRHGLLERAGARLDRRDGRAQQAHALDVGLLAAHVLGAHVDDALEPQQRARGGAGDAVLAGAGLGDDPRLAHPLGQQRLAERVVDLVRAGVEQVLALEVDRPAGALREPPRLVQRRRAARVVAQQPRQVGLEAGVGARLDPRRLELGERGHQRLGDELAAVGAEAMLDRGHTTRRAVAPRRSRGSAAPSRDP